MTPIRSDEKLSPVANSAQGCQLESTLSKRLYPSLFITMNPGFLVRLPIYNLTTPAPMSLTMSSRKNAKIHYSSLSTIMLQKNPSTNDDYTAPYINYKTCKSAENLEQTDPKLFFYVLCKQL
jgi:hypothetical protein